MKDNDPHPKPILAVNKYQKTFTARLETDAEESAEAFKEARSQSREALMLDVRQADGTIDSFPYHDLRRVRYKPTGVMVLHFGRVEVTAEGKNMHRLRDAIAEHRARFIQEGTDMERRQKPDDDTHIDRIVITEGDDE